MRGWSNGEGRRQAPGKARRAEWERNACGGRGGGQPSLFVPSQPDPRQPSTGPWHPHLPRALGTLGTSESGREEAALRPGVPTVHGQSARSLSVPVAVPPFSEDSP